MQADCPTDVVIGSNANGGPTLTLPRAVYNDVLDKATSGKDIVLGLLLKAFSTDELPSYNYFGGSVNVLGVMVEKRPLVHEERFKAILAQAEKEFPDCTTGIMRKEIRYAVNAKCRKIAQRIRRL